MPYKDPEKQKLSRKLYLKSNKGKIYVFRCNLKSRNGIDFDQFSKMIINQQGLCANLGCKRQLIGKRDPCIDHNHSCCSGTLSCGKCIRGLLCWHCNITLGHVEDSIKKLEGLKKYLNKENKNVAGN